MADRLRTILGGALLATALGCEPPTPAPLTATVRLPLVQLRLDNGLEVILHEDHHSPEVAINLWYGVGSGDDPPGKSGMAHLFEHLMFQGSRHVGEDDFNRYLDAAGSTERNGSTNADRTNYYETVPANQLELALWLESDRMAFLLDHVTGKVLSDEREVVKNEWRQRYENEPYGNVRVFVDSALYPPTHPYHRSTIGLPEELDRVTLDDVRTFDRAYYVPNNATLVIAGDIDRERVKELVTKYFGPIAPGALAPHRSAPAVVALDHERRLVIDADVDAPRVVITWPSPPAFYDGDAALKFAAWLTIGGLSHVLVNDHAAATRVRVSQDGRQLAGTFNVTATLTPNERPEDALALIDGYLARLQTLTFTAESYDRCRSALVMDRVFDIEHLSSRAEAINYYYRFTGRPEFLGQELAEYGALERGEVRAATQAYVTPLKRVVTFVRRNAQALHSGTLISKT